MRATFVYRLYPSPAQAHRWDQIRETCRRFYNQCLAERKTAYEERGETIGKTEQLRHVKQEKAHNPYAKHLHSHILQMVVDTVDKAFQAFFRRVKAGEKPGYPRFKGQNRFQSFGLKEYGNGFKIDGRRLRVHGVGRIPVRWHRPIEGQIKTLRLIKKAGKWYACFSCIVAEQPLCSTGQEIGIDVGIESLLSLSEGEQMENPRWYQTEHRRLRVCQRRVARRKKGGANRHKAVLMLQRQHERIANRRKDVLHKLVHQFVASYDRLALEDLRIAPMMHHPSLAKSILDAGWGSFVAHLTYKAASAGRVVELVNPRNTSKICSQCGKLHASLSLKDRWFSCACGLSIHRDVNAARNILRLGQSRWASSSPRGGLAQEAAEL